MPAFRVKLGTDDLNYVDVPLNHTHSLTLHNDESHMSQIAQNVPNSMFDCSVSVTCGTNMLTFLLLFTSDLCAGLNFSARPVHFLARLSILISRVLGPAQPGLLNFMASV